MSIVQELEDKLLLSKIQHGDATAFGVVYDKYVDPMYRFISFRVRSKEQAQDLTSELFAKAWQYLSSGSERGITNLRAYLYQSARNIIADYYRTRQETLPLEQAVEVSSNIHISFDTRISLEQVEVALTKLKDEWQEIVLLAYVEGFKPREIAKIIGKSQAATRVTLHRALKELRTLLETKDHNLKL